MSLCGASTHAGTKDLGGGDGGGGDGGDGGGGDDSSSKRSTPPAPQVILENSVRCDY